MYIHKHFATPWASIGAQGVAKMSLWVGHRANDDKVLKSWFSWHFPVVSRFRNLRMMMTRESWEISSHEWVSCHDPQKRNPRPNHFSAPSPARIRVLRRKTFPFSYRKFTKYYIAEGVINPHYLQTFKNLLVGLRGPAMIYLMEVTKVKVCKAAGG